MAGEKGGRYIVGENYVDAHGKVLGPVKEPEPEKAQKPEEQPKRSRKKSE